jgi:C1A family cysteine protease
MTTRLGWKKDKYDKKDYLHRVSRRAIPASLVMPQPAIRDQGNLGSCTAFGIGGVVTATMMQVNIFVDWENAKWIYNGERYLEGTLNYDSGAYPRDGWEWLLSTGCGLLEPDWPYSDELDPTPPPSKFNAKAATLPLQAYFRITGGVASICDALAQGYYVSLGIPWFDTWMDPPNGVLPNISRKSNMVGGHEIFIYGYDQGQQIFFCQNSWGDSWGNKGRFTLPFQAFDYFNRFGGYDAHYMTMDWAPAPPVPPTPPTPPEPPAPPTPATKKIRVQESIDGSDYQTIYEGEV